MRLDVNNYKLQYLSRYMPSLAIESLPFAKQCLPYQFNPTKLVNVKIPFPDLNHISTKIVIISSRGGIWTVASFLL